MLCGRLAGPWVDELRSSWQDRGRRQTAGTVVVDLSDVTFIDEAGEALLATMRREGAELLAAGVDNTDLVACLSDAGDRPLRRQIEHLSTPCVKPEQS